MDRRNSGVLPGQVNLSPVRNLSRRAFNIPMEAINVQVESWHRQQQRHMFHQQASNFARRHQEVTRAVAAAGAPTATITRNAMEDRRSPHIQITCHIGKPVFLPELVRSSFVPYNDASPGTVIPVPGPLFGAWPPYASPPPAQEMPEVDAEEMVVNGACGDHSTIEGTIYSSDLVQTTFSKTDAGSLGSGSETQSAFELSDYDSFDSETESDYTLTDSESSNCDGL